MKKKSLIISLILFCFTNFTYSQTKDTIHGLDSIPIVNTAFQAGEYLKYEVKYGLINGGEAEMIIGSEQAGFNWFYHVKAIARTTGITKSVAKINDRYESYIEMNSGLPVKAIRDIRENNYRKYNEIIFHRKQNKVTSLESGEFNVPVGTLDILSAFYFARRYIFNKNLKKGDIINLTTFFDDEIFTIKIKFDNQEDFNSNFGKINCLKFVPVIEAGSPFKKEEDLQVWFSNDGNFIPVRIRLKMKISSIKCDLISYENLINPFGAKSKNKK